VNERAVKNTAASVRERLLQRAKSSPEDFQFVLMRYGVERLMFRLSQSTHAGDFVLKGAMLYLVWTGTQYRTIKNMDLLALRSASVDGLESVFRSLCEMDSVEDGLRFQPLRVLVVAGGPPGSVVLPTIARLTATPDSLRRNALKQAENWLLTRATPRLHMALIASATGAAALLFSFLMLRAGLGTMGMRYPLAVGLAYGVLLLLLPLWLNCATSSEASGPGEGWLDVADGLSQISSP